MVIADGDLWGPPYTQQVALRVLQIVGDHTNGLDTAQVRVVADGLSMIPGNLVTHRLGNMLQALMDTAVTAQMTESGDPLDWEKVRL
jgi:hypothetical protein